MHLVHVATLTGLLWMSVAAGQEPAPRRDVERRISALLAKRNIQQALSTYDSYVSASKRPDAALLRLIAQAELERAAAPGNAPAVRIPALEYLARGGNNEALGALRKVASSGNDAGLSARISLVHLGQQGAASSLADLLSSASAADRPRIIEALQDADARAEASKLMPLLDSADVPTRTAAVLALGTLQHEPAREKLRTMLAGDAVTRMIAAIALRRLGDETVDAQVAPLLGGILPEVRLMAAEAYGPAANRRWVPKIKELSTNRNELIRVRAAELLACCDAPTARTILAAALDSSIPSVQAEAARVLASTGLADARNGRRMLGSEADEVRAHGAGAVMRIKDKPKA